MRFTGRIDMVNTSVRNASAILTPQRCAASPSRVRAAAAVRLVQRTRKCFDTATSCVVMTFVRVTREAWNNLYG